MRKHRDAKITSHIMRHVKSKGSKAERLLGQTLWGMGLRYRKHPKDLTGKPDYIFLAQKIAIFVDGDFWHGKGWESRGFDFWDEQFEGLNNADFWKAKIARNMARDIEVNALLTADGWLVLRFLESEILETPQSVGECIRLEVLLRKYPT